MRSPHQLYDSCRLPGFLPESPTTPDTPAASGPSEHSRDEPAPAADAPRLYRAGLLLPLASPPIADGAVLVADGRVRALGPARELIREHGDAAVACEMPGAVLLPGLVNAHCHLSLSIAEGLLPPREDFVDWILGLVAARRSWTEREFELSIRAGLRETLRGGCACLGDIVTDWDFDAWGFLGAEHAPLRIRGFREWLGWPEGERRAAAASAAAWLAAEGFVTGAAESGTGRGEDGCPARAGGLFPGLSPHAPYSTHPQLYEELITLAEGAGLPLSTHAAETAAEVEFLRAGTGPFADLHRRVGWKGDGAAAWGKRSFARWLAERAPGVPLQLVHGTQLGDEEIALLAGLDATVVYCPGSVAWFCGDEDPHPVTRLLAAGVTVALGTDSLASSPSLNLPLTCTLAHRAHPELEPEVILEMVTRAGARSLGFPDAGALAPGGPADFLLFDLAGVGDASRLSAAEAVEGALLSGYRVPSLHVFAGEPYAFAGLPPFPRS